MSWLCCTPPGMPRSPAVPSSPAWQARGQLGPPPAPAVAPPTERCPWPGRGLCACGAALPEAPSHGGLRVRGAAGGSPSPRCQVRPPSPCPAGAQGGGPARDAAPQPQHHCDGRARDPATTLAPPPQSEDKHRTPSPTPAAPSHLVPTSPCLQPPPKTSQPPCTPPNPFVPHTQRPPWQAPWCPPAPLQTLPYPLPEPSLPTPGLARTLGATPAVCGCHGAPPGPAPLPPSPAPLPSRCRRSRRCDGREEGGGGGGYSKRDRLKNETRQGQRPGPLCRKRGLLPARPPGPVRGRGVPARPSAEGEGEAAAGAGTVPGGHKHWGATGSCTTA